MLTVRPVTARETDRAMEIFDIARSFMRQNGNMTQWINGYPGRDMVERDITDGKMYAVFCGDEMCGVFFFDICRDPTYNYIENGQWLNDKPYGVIHRIGSDGRFRGVLAAALDFAFGKINNIKIDTHSDNTVMQHLLEKYGFQKCGTIYIEDGSPRVAFQKTV